VSTVKSLARSACDMNAGVLRKVTESDSLFHKKGPNVSCSYLDEHFKESRNKLTSNSGNALDFSLAVNHVVITHSFAFNEVESGK